MQLGFVEIIRDLHRANQAGSEVTDATRTANIDTAMDRVSAGQRVFRCAGMGSLLNRRLSQRWFEPSTCHYLRKRPMSWGSADGTVALSVHVIMRQ